MPLDMSSHPEQVLSGALRACPWPNPEKGQRVQEGAGMAGHGVGWAFVFCRGGQQQHPVSRLTGRGTSTPLDSVFIVPHWGTICLAWVFRATGGL